MLPKVGIIYLTYPTQNWERDINRCLASLEHLNYPKDRVELICVESKGKIAPLKDWFAQTWMLKSDQALPRITYVYHDEWIGFSGNNNFGFAKAKEFGCDYIYLLNEDTDVSPDFLSRAVERAESDPKVAIVQSLMLLGDERDKINSTGNSFHYLGFGYSNDYLSALASVGPLTAREIGYASGAAMLIKVSTLDQEKLFDEKFYSYHEDTDLCLRQRLRGYRIVLEPTSVIWHYYEFGKSKMNYYYMERNRYALMFSYYRLWTLFVLFPMLLVMDAAIFAFSFKSGWADMKWKVYKDFCSRDFWKWIRSRRHDLQSVRRMCDCELLRLAVSTIAFQDSNVKNPLLTYVGNPLLRVYWWVARRLIA